MKILTLCFAMALLNSPLFSMEKQPKNLFFRIDLANNIAHFGHFDTTNHALKPIDTQALTAYNEDDMMQLIENELDAIAQNRKVLLFIHGMFGNREAFLHRDFFALEEDYGTSNDLVIHIIWEGQSINQRVNRQNARNSAAFVTPILRGVLKLENTASVLMCHSMGGYLLFELMDELTNLPKPFEKIFLMAPDVALSVFEQNLAQLEAIGKKTAVFYNKKDRVLLASRIATGQPRLGRKGTTVQRDFIEVTDCTKEKNKTFVGKMSQHSYFRTSPVVRESLRKQINF